jgi:hypothetical protein
VIRIDSETCSDRYIRHRTFFTAPVNQLYDVLRSYQRNASDEPFETRCFDAPRSVRRRWGGFLQACRRDVSPKDFADKSGSGGLANLEMMFRYPERLCLLFAMDGYLSLKLIVDRHAVFLRAFFPLTADSRGDLLFLRTRFENTFSLATPARAATETKSSGFIVAAAKHSAERTYVQATFSRLRGLLSSVW